MELAGWWDVFFAFFDLRWCPKSWSRGHPPTFTSTSSQLERVCCCQILIHVPHRNCLNMFESLFEHAQFLGATAPFGSLSALRGVSPAWSPCHQWKIEKVWKSLKKFGKPLNDPNHSKSICGDPNLVPSPGHHRYHIPWRIWKLLRQLCTLFLTERLPRASN